MYLYIHIFPHWIIISWWKIELSICIFNAVISTSDHSFKLVKTSLQVTNSYKYHISKYSMCLFLKKKKKRQTTTTTTKDILFQCKHRTQRNSSHFSRIRIVVEFPYIQTQVWWTAVPCSLTCTLKVLLLCTNSLSFIFPFSYH